MNQKAQALMPSGWTGSSTRMRVASTAVKFEDRQASRMWRTTGVEQVDHATGRGRERVCDRLSPITTEAPKVIAGELAAALARSRGEFAGAERYKSSAIDAYRRRVTANASALDALLEHGRSAPTMPDHSGSAH